MREPVLTVSWNNHATELTTVCKTLLENNYFVDCTIAAEGKSLKAHRLILSACSPYFHMRFSAECDKHPIVILKNTLFDTLKMMMDFVYNGKVDIPANQFEAFLELAVSLQINGLKDSLRKDRGTDIGSSAEGNTSQRTSRALQRVCEFGSSRTNCEGSLSNSSQQYNFGLAQGCTDTPRESSALFIESRNSCEMVQSGAISLRDRQSCIVYNDIKMSVNTETRVKYVPFDSEIQILEPESKKPDYGKQDNFTHGNFMTTISDESRPSFRQNLDQYAQRESSVPLMKSADSHKVVPSGAETIHLQGHLSRTVCDTEMSANTETSVQYSAFDSDIGILETKTELSDDDDDKQEESTSANFQTKMTESSASFGSKVDENSCERKFVRVTGNSGMLRISTALSLHKQSQLPTYHKNQQHQSPVRRRSQESNHQRQGPSRREQTQSQEQEQQLKHLHQPQHPSEPQYPSLAPHPSEPVQVSQLEQPSQSQQPSQPQQAVQPHLPTQLQQLPQQERLLGTRMFSELSSSPELPGQHDPLLPERSVPRKDNTYDVESKESMDAVAECDAVEMDEGKEPTLQTNLSSHHGAEGPSPAQDEQQATQQRRRRPRRAKDHVRLTRDASLQCSECGASFTSPQGLEDHRRQHSVEEPPLSDPAAHEPKRTAKRPHSSNVRKKGLHSSRALAVHKPTDKGEKPYSCDVCGKAFNESGDLVKHNRIHTGEKPYLCDVCGKAFSQSSHLAHHKRIHEGEKPYPCDVCGKAFTSSSNLAVHKRIHTGEKPYPCDVCEKAFSQSGHLAYHKRIHTGEKPYPCDVCGKAFSDSSALACHKRIHTGEKPYPCDVCGKAFNNPWVLARHKRIHTQGRFFDCDACSLRLFSRTEFIAHWRRCRKKQ